MAYLGTQPNDVKKNTGLYTPSEILQLTKDGSWGGSLELIEEQTASGVSSLEFTSIKETIYNVHLMTFNNIDYGSGSDRLNARYSNDGGSTYESGSDYQRAQQTGNTSGTFGESKGTSDTSAIVCNLSDTSTNDTAQGYNYFYNLGDSAKFSFTTMHSSSMRGASHYEFRFGGTVYAVAETINAIQILSNSTSNFSGTVKLYGVKQI